MDDEKESKKIIQFINEKKISKQELALLFIKINNVIDDNYIKNIAEKTGLVNYYNNDLKHKNWNKKATAILFNYELNLDNNINFIKSLTNNKNIIVRREAQITVLKSQGWKSLKFLSKISEPISLWQQIRMIEQLKQYHPVVNVKHLEAAKQASNPYIIQLILRLINTFEIENQLDFILKQTNSSFKFISETANETLDNYKTNNQFNIENKNVQITHNK